MTFLEISKWVLPSFQLWLILEWKQKTESQFLPCPFVENGSGLCCKLHEAMDHQALFLPEQTVQKCGVCIRQGTWSIWSSVALLRSSPLFPGRLLRGHSLSGQPEGGLKHQCVAWAELPSCFPVRFGGLLLWVALRCWAPVAQRGDLSTARPCAFPCPSPSHCLLCCRCFLGASRT